jgi:hypothetical protein
MTMQDPFASSSVVAGLAPRARATEHIVHFYGDETFFLQELTDYALGALTANDAAVIIATPEHRRELDARLVARGIEMDRARREGLYLEADAARTLAKFVVDGRIDPARFGNTAGTLIGGAMGFTGTRRVRAFGEMVALLCQDGRYDLARELESLWVALARRLSFSLLCAYPTGLFREERSAHDLGEISALHDRVIRSGHVAPVADAAGE